MAREFEIIGECFTGVFNGKRYRIETDPNDEEQVTVTRRRGVHECIVIFPITIDSAVKLDTKSGTDDLAREIVREFKEQSRYRYRSSPSVQDDEDTDMALRQLEDAGYFPFEDRYFENLYINRLNTGQDYYQLQFNPY